MSMVLIVRMPVLVLHALVTMLVTVSFGQMQPNADRHQHGRSQKIRRESVVQENDGDRSTSEWRQREVRASPCASDMTERQDE